MKENRYDEKIFFEKYAGMERSKKGLAGAGEWHELEKMLPGFTGRRVLDLGCGFGWHCIYAAQHGAKSVTGVDISQKMLDVAREKTPFENVRYICAPIEDITFEASSFDIVLSSLAFHYVKDFGAVCARVYDFLSPGGSFIFSVEHPVFTASGPQEWHCDAGGNKLHWPVDHYFSEGVRDAVFLGEHITKYHRTLQTYIKSLRTTGFSIIDIAEPMPDARMQRDIPGMADELRRPMMLIISAQKGQRNCG